MVLLNVRIAPAVLLLFSLLATSFAWDSEDLEVFDVVEEVGRNFYELLDVSPNVDAKTIKRAFRNMSLQLHPDKNSAPDAEVKFRQLVAVHDILKDPNKRAKYDDVLLNGLPDWRQAVYYYRRVRKMGLAEMSIILFIIITISQYCVAWAAYFEKKYTIEEYIRYKSKRLQKKQKKGKTVDEVAAKIMPDLVASLPKPSVTCTLPVQICRLCWFLVVDAPLLTYRRVKTYFEERGQAAIQQEEESSEEEEVYVPRERGPRRRKGFQLLEANDTGETVETLPPIRTSAKSNGATPAPVYKGGLWTDDDLISLMKLMNKFRQGSTDRWQKIAQALERNPVEVAQMGHKMKDRAIPMVKATEEEPEVSVLLPKKVKTRVTPSTEDASWSAAQQKALETALAVHPKGCTGDRWSRIASSVPDKTKEECMARYKKLHDAIRKMKDGASEVASS